MSWDAAPGPTRTLGRATKVGLAGGLGLAAVDLACLATMPSVKAGLVLFASLVLALAVFGVVLLRRAGIRGPTLVVFAASALLVALYLSSTSFDERNYDALVHLQYVREIITGRRLPTGAECSICHHPPLYHLLAAVVVTVADHGRLASAPFALQVFSAGLFFVFLGFGTLAVEQLSSSSKVQPWAAAFLAFWPVSVINSVRLNNDLLAFALTAAALYYLTLWRRQGRRAKLAVACILACAAVATKLNGLVLVAAVFGLFVWDAVRAGEPRARARRDAPVVGVLAAVLGLMGGVRWWRESGTFTRRALGAASDEGAVHTGSVWYYVRLDLERYFDNPYSVADQAGYGAPYWNHVLKSSLFGTRSVFLWGDGETFDSSRTLALVAGGLLFVLIAYMAGAAGYLRRVPRDHRALSPYLAGCFFSAALLFHVWAPKPHHADFRFIYPVLIPIAAVFFEATEAVRRRWRAAGVLGYALLVVFWSVSISFFAFGARPTLERLAERVVPGPKAEEAQPNRIPRIRLLRPRTSAEPR